LCCAESELRLLLLVGIDPKDLAHCGHFAEYRVNVGLLRSVA